MNNPQRHPAAEPESLHDDQRDRAIAAAGVGIWQWDVRAGEASFDPLWCRGVGIDPHAWASGGWHRNVHPDDLADLRKRLTELAANGANPFEAEYRLLTDDYRWVWILQRGRVIERDAEGRTLHVAGICIDIDERKREEVGQREHESRLATALWGARAAFWTWHVPTNKGTRSALWYAMTGYTREQWDSVPLPFTSRLHPEDREQTLAAARAHIEGRSESMESEYRIRTADGGWKWMLGRGRSVEWDLEGKATLVIGVSLDIDAQKQAEQQLLHGETRFEDERGALLRDVEGAALVLRDIVERLRAEDSATLADGERALARLEAALV